MTGEGYRNNSELTDNQLKMLKSLNRIDSMGIVPFDRNHERTLRSLARKGFAKRGHRNARYFITDAGVDRLGPRPENATRSRRGT